jgi:hypothetical protein
MISNNSIDDHRRRFSRRILAYSGFFVLFITACILPFSQLTQTPIVITVTPLTSTEAPIASPTAAITTTNPPSCTVLQDLNLRSGPGTAYNPPLTVLKAGDEFVPVGFDPQGIPGGSWVQARVASINQTGWVSAGEQFVTCNIDFATLPEIDVPPPPRAASPRIGTGDVDGDNISSFRSAFDYTPDYFVRFYVFRSDDPDEQFSFDKDGRGITSVEFRVTSPDGGTIYYESRENTPGYCIFGGGEPDCNLWVYEDGQYKWSSGGDPVEEQSYQLLITANAEDGQVGQWFIVNNIDLK